MPQFMNMPVAPLAAGIFTETERWPEGSRVVKDLERLKQGMSIFRRRSSWFCGISSERLKVKLFYAHKKEGIAFAIAISLTYPLRSVTPTGAAHAGLAADLLDGRLFLVVHSWYCAEILGIRVALHFGCSCCPNNPSAVILHQSE